MADLKPIQRIFLHMARDLLLCDHVGDVGNDIESWSKIFAVILPEDGDGFDLDAIDELLACENPGRHGEDFRVLVEAELLRDISVEAEAPVVAPTIENYLSLVVEIEDQEERGLDQHAVYEILRTALPSLGFKLRTCGTRESMRQGFANEQARLDREDLSEFLTEHRLARAAREAAADREQGGYGEVEPA